jgi:hypothetical protein
LITCEIIYCPTVAPLATAATKAAVLILCRCWVWTDAWRDFVLLEVIRPMFTVQITII